MFTIVFYAMICTAPIAGTADKQECNDFQPMSWSVNSYEEEEKAYEECSILANAYLKLESVEEVDCYREEVK